MKPAKFPVSRKHAKIAVAIDRARQCGVEPEYQAGVRAAAREIAKDHVPPSEHSSFFVACGLDPNAGSDHGDLAGLDALVEKL